MSAATKQLGDGRPYHLYEIYTPYSKEGGQHHLAAFSVKVRVGGRVGGKGGEGGGGGLYAWGALVAETALIDTHCALHCSAQGDLAYLFVISANDKQWAGSEAKLRSMLEAFRA